MLHFRIFAVGQASRLFQYFIAYRYLSDVMECAGKIHFLGGVLVKSHKPGQIIPLRRPHPENVYW